jgi:hypothetical protein
MAGQNILRFYAPKRDLKLDISQTFDYKKGESVVFDIKLDDSETFDFILDTSSDYNLDLINYSTPIIYNDLIIDRNLPPQYDHVIMSEDNYFLHDQNNNLIQFQY